MENERARANYGHLISHYKVTLGHGMGCNGRAYKKAMRGSKYVRGSNYKVACCVVCQDSEGRLLITRR